MFASILIRSLNRGRYLEKAIASALAQDYASGRLEVIVVDDGSTDESPRILARHADRIRLLPGPGKGAVAALNLAVRASRGEVLTILDADDWAEPQLVSELARPLAAEPELGFSYCDYFEETPLGGGRRLVSLARDPFQGIAAGFMYRKSLVETVGLYDEALLFAEYDLLAKALGVSAGRHVPKALYHYVRHGANLTSDPARVRSELSKLRSRHGPSFRIRDYPADRLSLRLTRLDETDMRFLWDLKNDPGSLAASFHPEPVPWETHRAWFEERAKSADCRIYLACRDEGKVGMARFDRQDPTRWEVSVALLPRLRGSGLGPLLLAAAEAELRREFPRAWLVARIRLDNPASQAAFRKAGYAPCERIEVGGIPGERWEKRF